MFAAMTQPRLTCQVFDGRLRRPMALAVRTPAVSTHGVLAVGDVDVLGVVAARDAAYPAVRDVRAGDGVPPPGLLLIVREIAHLAAGRFYPAGDPAQAVRPVPGAAHQVRDLRDILVLFDGAVLGDAGLPRVRGELPDRLLVGYLQPQLTCP